MGVVEAVQRDIEKIAKRDPELAESGLAASALALAREMDSDSSATSKSMCAKALLETLDRLRELAPAAPKRTDVDDIRDRAALKLRRVS